VERPANGGDLLCAVPAGGRLSGLEAKAGLGGVQGVDAQSHREDDAGGAGDADGAAAVAVGVAATKGRRLVAAPAVESQQEPAERAGRRKAALAASRGNAASSGGLAGQRSNGRGLREPYACYVTA